MTWKIKTYDQEPMALEAVKVKCPLCGLTRPAIVMVDVSNLPASLTRGEKWACDGCWTGWEREEREGFDESVLLEAAGAPEEVVQKIRAIVGKRREKFGKAQ